MVLQFAALPVLVFIFLLLKEGGPIIQAMGGKMAQNGDLLRLPTADRLDQLKLELSV